jgi:hypothetical protein
MSANDSTLIIQFAKHNIFKSHTEPAKQVLYPNREHQEAIITMEDNNKADTQAFLPPSVL